ncbi:hypothetical protein [Aurantiacibacter rhizosphaerae]|uniref:RcnB family protein n=1 Tax=Aurantiacibacter rhizosphaerae TaxID=2691582 RepID=A0A844XC51_9SPHN|nr:hypothetical protein [Aurantiacibacter rhizosphaerae]MWV27359.1 hypothetical protein [Aurantiacibacter rhizosphaerae]
MKLWIASISAIALAASPALAQGNGNGNKGNNGNGGGQRAEAPGPGKGNGQGKGNGNANRDKRGGQQQERGNRDAGPQKRGNGNADRGNADRGNGKADRGDRGDRGNVNRGNADNGNGRTANRGNDFDRRYDGDRNGNGNSRNRGGDGISIGYDDGPNFDFRRASRGIAEGCPPGLARKYNGCRPPGQARKQDGNRYYDYSPNWWGLGDLFGDRRGNYYYDDGFLMQLGRGGAISGYIPLLGGALSIGNPWPQDYRYSRMPAYYEDYYGLGGRDNYRYADNVVYRLDPETTAITSIAALLTGDEFTVGQPMPRGYDVYNVPYSYRDRYYDGPQSMYRYNDGYIYEIDPETRLVAAAIEMLI